MKSVNTFTVTLPILHCSREDMQDYNVWAWCTVMPEPQGRSLCRMSRSTSWSRSSTIQLPSLGVWAATCTCAHPHNQDQASFENAIVCITDFLYPVICWQTPMLILLGIVSSAVTNISVVCQLTIPQGATRSGTGSQGSSDSGVLKQLYTVLFKPTERISLAVALAFELFWPLLQSFMKIWVWLALPVSLSIQLHLCFHGA